MKKCTICGIEKPATREFFYGDKCNTTGLAPRCKSCDSRRRTSSAPKYRRRTPAADLPSAMGHRFEDGGSHDLRNLRCSQKGCGVAWDRHRERPVPCQPPAGRNEGSAIERAAEALQR